MAILHLDLSRDATRRTLLANLRGRLDAQAQAALDAAVKNSGVPCRHHHDLGDVLATLASLRVSDHVKHDAREVYRLLAAAEASVHDCPVEETHFHEVGNAEAIFNVVAVCLAVEALSPSLITSTPVQTGRGMVVCAHGELPIPAPATAAILGDDIPRCENRLDGELCTPTSAALIRYFVDRFEV